jgi:two-component system OmpR family sensor kinase
MKKLDTEALVSMEQEVDRLTRLVGDLLLLAQAESRRMPLDIKCIELDNLILEVFKQMRLLAGDKLKVVLSEIDQVQVMGDRDRLKQVFLNLAGNAIQYTPKDGEVVLTLRKTEKQAMVVIADNGPGIPEEDLPHIFERFYRSDHSRARKNDESFGLGLSIAYWIVHNHGGVIDVSSQPGKGSTFCVRLPICTNGPEKTGDDPEKRNDR